MHSTLVPRLGRLALVGLVALTASVTACSDSDDEPASPGPAADAEWCEAARAVNNAVSSRVLEATEAAAAVAPDELQDAYATVVDYLRFEAENPTDAVGIAERKAELGEPAVTIAVALKERCGIDTAFY